MSDQFSHRIATQPDEPLYRARGYIEFERDIERTKNGAVNTIIRMRKSL